MHVWPAQLFLWYVWNVLWVHWAYLHVVVSAYLPIISLHIACTHLSVVCLYKHVHCHVSNYICMYMCVQRCGLVYSMVSSDHIINSLLFLPLPPHTMIHATHTIQCQPQHSTSNRQCWSFSVRCWSWTTLKSKGDPYRTHKESSLPRKSKVSVHVIAENVLHLHVKWSWCVCSVITEGSSLKAILLWCSNSP